MNMDYGLHISYIFYTYYIYIYTNESVVSLDFNSNTRLYVREYSCSLEIHTENECLKGRDISNLFSNCSEKNSCILQLCSAIKFVHLDK